MSASAESDVAHLRELGYEDPQESAAKRAAAERCLDEQLVEARVRLESGDLAAAIDQLEGLAAASPEWAAPRASLARAYLQAGRFGAAEQCLAWLETHGIEHPQFSLMRATIAAAQRRFNAAMDEAEYARSMNNALPAAEVLLGEIHLRCGRLNAAAEAFERALAVRADDAGALVGLANVSLRRGDDDRAIDLALQALDVTLEWPAAHLCLGLALARIERPADAVTALETFVKLAPCRAAAAARLMARICEGAGDVAQAAARRERSRKLVRERRVQRARDSCVKT